MFSSECPQNIETVRERSKLNYQAFLARVAVMAKGLNEPCQSVQPLTKTGLLVRKSSQSLNTAVPSANIEPILDYQ